MSILDWAAFTVPIEFTEKQPGENAFQKRIQRVVDKLAEWLPDVLVHSTENLSVTTSQRPYRRAWKCPNMGWVINADWKRKECLIVFNGSACEQLRKVGGLAHKQVLLMVAESGTRLDLATDIETMMDIKEIEVAGWTERISSTSYITSSSGDTLYVGSRKSEACARIYRYRDPHPRAHLMRVEHELKQGRARAVASIAALHGIEAAQLSVASRFDYKHHALLDRFTGETYKIETEAHKKDKAKTEIWLMTQCAPAFQKLVKEGVIDDPKAWVKKYMLGDI